MSSDKHFNEPGVMPKPLRDRKGTDMPATRGIVIAIIVVAVLGLLAIALSRWI